MPIDKEKIKSAMDDFENDNFIDAKDTLKGEIKGAISDYFKDKLELKNDLEPKAEVKADAGETGDAWPVASWPSYRALRWPSYQG